MSEEGQSPVAQVEDARVDNGLLVLMVRAAHRVREHQEPADHHRGQAHAYRRVLGGGAFL